MKKVIRSVLLPLLALVMIFSAAPVGAAASSNAANKTAVYRFLTNTLKLNRAAASGIMANIEKESNFKPNSVVIDSNGKPSGGLCQWNGARFANLKSFCSKNGYDYLSITGQMNYLKSELNTSGYKKILTYLKGLSNNESGAYNSGYYWCYNFERPANKASKSVQRGNLAKSYFKSFAPTADELKAVSVSLSASSVSFLGGKLKISWGSGGSSCTGYIVELAKLSGGKYNWNQATGAYTTGKSYTFTAYELGTGMFGVRVKSLSDTSTKTSSVSKVTIKCSSHLYSSKVSKAATASAAGTITYTCQYCGAKTNKTIAKGTNSVKSLKSPTVSATYSGGITTVKYSGVSNATGYVIYVSSGSKWVKLATMPKGTSTAKLLDVPKGSKVAVMAFYTVGSKTVNSATIAAKVK